MKKILIFVPSHAVAMSISLIKDMCWVASIYEARQRGTKPAPERQIMLVTADGKPVTCFSGIKIKPDISIKKSENPDALFIAAFWGPAKDIIEKDAAVLPWLQSLHSANVPIAAVSNGQFFLGASGLLSDKVATIYPSAAETFKHYYPDVKLRPKRAITDAGNLYCANGIASGCDLIVTVIEAIYGPEIARQIATEFLLGFNRSYELSNVKFDGQKYHKDKQILTAQQWLERNYGENIQLANVASDIGMSPRNFSRRFRDATGDSPSRYLKRVRMEVAQELLKTTSLSQSEISYRSGYQDNSYFGKQFTEYTGLTPHQYRQAAE